MGTQAIFRVLLNFHECFYDKENMFSISYINNVASTAHASSVFLLGYSSKIFNQRAWKFSLGCFLCKIDISKIHSHV